MIKGGYIIIARQILNSEIMDKPPLYSKLWLWMLNKAKFSDRDNSLERGQFKTSINEMREAMSWKVGYRKVTPTSKEIRNPYEWFLRGTMIDSTKVTGGMVITILNYDKYQTPKNYEGHNEGHDDNTAKVIQGAHLINKKNVKNEKKINNVELVERIISFLNNEIGSNFRSTTKETIKVINARLIEGFTEDDFYTVIKNKKTSWINNPKFSKFLRPETLFGNKFEGYLNEKQANNNNGLNAKQAHELLEKGLL